MIKAPLQQKNEMNGSRVTSSNCDSENPDSKLQDQKKTELKKTAKRKTRNPCEKCFLHKELCICALIPSLDLQTRIILVVHAKELKRTTNTGRLALHALTNSKMFIRGEGREALELSSILMEGYDSYLLYPSDDAIELSQVVKKKRKNPIQLIIPDGNWRQASKVASRHPELLHVPRVKLSVKNLANDHLRKEHFAEGFSTLEAIALALGIVEGPNAEAKLRELYQAKLKATLLGRGAKSE